MILLHLCFTLCNCCEIFRMTTWQLHHCMGLAIDLANLANRHLQICALLQFTQILTAKWIGRLLNNCKMLPCKLFKHLRSHLIN